MERKLITKTDILIIASLLIVVALIFSVRYFFQSNEKIIAEVYCNGKLVDTVDLTKEEEKKIITGDENSVVIVSKDGKIYFQESSCHDKICVNSGVLDKSGDFSACLPEKVIVKVVGEKEAASPDAIVY